MKRFDTLVLATANFPFGGVTEEAFVMPEIPHLAAEFKKVVIIPTFFGERCGEMPLLPDNVEVDDTFAKMIGRKAARLRYLLHPMVAGAAADAMLHAHNPVSAATYAASTLSWKKELETFLKERRLGPESTLLYSFWFDFPASAMALVADRSGYKVISRIHGYELRHLRSPMLKRLTVANLQALYPVSVRATELLHRRYPDEARHIVMRHLGSQKTDLRQLGPHPDAESRHINFVSISRVIPLKRVGLILEMVKGVARRLPTHSVSWTHIGHGEAMVELTKDLSKSLPANLKVNLAGAMSNQAIHDMLASTPIHWNVLLSSAEGGVPIALCEGASYGIPAIASNVGGISELVDATTGILTDATPDIDDVAKRVVELIRNPEAYEALRVAIYRRWTANFASEHLRSEFAAAIAAGRWT